VKPHGTDLISLTFGLVFIAAAALWALTRVVDVGTAMIGWAAVAGLIVMGAVGITQAVVTANRRRRHTDDQPQ
jgi:hypothetical protein